MNVSGANCYLLALVMVLKVKMLDEVKKFKAGDTSILQGATRFQHSALGAWGNAQSPTAPPNTPP